MIATAAPDPFPHATGFVITITDGTPPYDVTIDPSPPNPAGVRVILGPPIRVMVPLGTPPGMVVTVQVTDSSNPPQSVPVSATTA